MEQDVQTDRLYDFLYRDSSRITSYYAEIFGGHLTSLQQTESERDTADRGAKLNVQVLSSDLKSGKANLQSETRVINPHDLITTDVLAQLRADNRFNNDVEGAPHGSLIVAEGTLVLIDRSMLELAKVVLQTQADEQLRVARSQTEKAAARAIKQIIPFLASVVLDSYCALSMG